VEGELAATDQEEEDEEQGELVEGELAATDQEEEDEEKGEEKLVKAEVEGEQGEQEEEEGEVVQGAVVEGEEDGGGILDEEEDDGHEKLGEEDGGGMLHNEEDDGQEKPDETQNDTLEQVNNSADGMDFTRNYGKKWECDYDINALYAFGSRHGLTAFEVQRILFSQKKGEEEDEFAGKSMEETLKCMEEWFVRIKKTLSDKTGKKFMKIVNRLSEDGLEDLVTYSECVLTWFCNK